MRRPVAGRAIAWLPGRAIAWLPGRAVPTLPALLVLAAFFGAWELYVDLGGVDSLLLPAPHQILAALYDDRRELWSNFLVSSKEIVLGSLAAAAAGLALAFAMHFSRPLRQALYPLLVASQAVPVPILAAPLAFWLGFGLAPKLAVVALVSFFSIVITTLSALAAVDRDLLKLMRTFDATRLRAFRYVELPAALPGLFTGLKLTLVVAVIADVFAEQNGSNSGLGYLLLTAVPNLQTAEAFAAALLLSLIAIVLFALLSVAERRLLPWTYQPRGAD
jgi:putative hydroxymethylpyrimidine transport system permease protein